MKRAILIIRPQHLLLALATGLTMGLTPSGALGVPQTAITWSAANDISGDTDVSTDGTLVSAFNLEAGVSTANVNGVNFTAFSINGNPTTVGNFTLQDSSGILQGQVGFGSTFAPYANLSSNYKTLLGTGAIASGPPTMTLTMSNLSTSQQYLFEWWSNLSESGNYTTTATAVNSVTLSEATTEGPGAEGQFAIGTFTPNTSTVTISFTCNGNPVGPLINAFQLRTVPEPGSMALLGFGVPAMLGAMRRWGRRVRG